MASAYEDADSRWFCCSRFVQVVRVFDFHLTGDDLADHAEHAIWLGDRQPVRLDVF